MQTSQNWDGLDLSRGVEDLVAEFLTSAHLRRSVLLQLLMRAQFHEVANVLAEYTSQVILAEEEDVVEAFALDGSEAAFADGVHERVLHGGAVHLCVTGLGDRLEFRLVLVVIVADQEPRPWQSGVASRKCCGACYRAPQLT